MLLTILARMSDDKQRLQLLQTLRNKLSNYNLTWLDIRNIIKLFSWKNYVRFDILQFLLLYTKNLMTKIDIEDFIDLSDLCTNNNEQMKVRLFEQIHRHLNIQSENDVERIINLFQIIHIRHKIQSMIEIHRSNTRSDEYKGISTTEFDLQLNTIDLFTTIILVIDTQQHISYPEEITVNNILSPILSSIEESTASATLKRKYSYDNAYQDHACHQIITPILTLQQDELIQQRDFLSSISISSSNSSISSASDENIPIRTRSFMIAIKNTFERLKETSS
ncbi:hypothetical protein I4U23_025431 [Adineta vaga]|nr:hypothetical protein I4U23_025431 [Adineta vaga]